MGQDIAYLVFPTKPSDLGSAIAGIRALSIIGASVTVPHKETVVDHLDNLDASARSLGAANTIVNRDGNLIGHNTDGRGFLDALTSAGFDPDGKKVVLLGAGGAARAVAVALDGAGAQLSIVNRSLGKAEAAAGLTKRGVATETPDVSEADLIVNATPVGMDDHPGLPSDAQLASGQLAVDLIYAPSETKWLVQARLNGAATMNGEAMLVFQAAEQIRLWTGEAAPVDVMFDAMSTHLQQHP